MNELDPFYAWLLNVGFGVLRDAIDSGRREWINAELELLHNMPSLIGEANVERHRYFWFTERLHYLDWVSAPGRDEAKWRMNTFYKPFWDDMEPIITRLIAEHNSRKR